MFFLKNLRRREMNDRSLNRYATARGRGLSNAESESAPRAVAGESPLVGEFRKWRSAPLAAPTRIADCEMTKHTSRLLHSEE